MYKKAIFTLSSFLLAAYNAEVTSEPSESSHAWGKSIDETTFMNVYGTQPWEDYKNLIDDFPPGEITMMNQ